MDEWRNDAPWPILVCVLGPFRIVRNGQPVPAPGGKTEALICHLALHSSTGVPRATLLDALWPGIDTTLAADALRSRVNSLNKLLGATVNPAAAPVLREDGRYVLNAAAGVRVDLACFDALATRGDREARSGCLAEAVASYQRAAQFYRGDLCVATDWHAVVERERLRARYLSLLAFLATYAYGAGDDGACLEYAQSALLHDPCREDFHRLLMRCYMRRGERAQALHQYRMCEDILRATFETTPEPATTALFEQLRLDPGSAV